MATAQYTATVRPSAAETLSTNFLALRMVLFAVILLSLSSMIIFAILQIIELHVILTIETESYLLATDIEPIQEQYNKRKTIIIVVTAILSAFKVTTFVVVYTKRKLLMKLWSILVFISCLGHIAISDFDSLIFEIVTICLLFIFTIIDRKKAKLGLKSLRF